MIPSFSCIPLLCIALGFTTINASAQSFPIVPVSDPTYPFDHPELENFDWQHDFDGVLQRLGDFNNDGLDDIVLIFVSSETNDLMHSKVPWVYLQNDNGGFDQPYWPDVTLNESYTGLIYDFIIQDHNNDGLNDLVIATDTSTLPLISTTTGFVGDQPIFPAITYNSPRLLYIDTDLDGDDDLVRWTKEGYQIEIWTNRGGGDYLQTTIINSFKFSDAHDNLDIRFIDLDTDGDLDILLLHNVHMEWCERTELGYRDPANFRFDTTNFDEDDAAAFADINADGHIDVVVNGTIPGEGEGYGFILGPLSRNVKREVPFYAFPVLLNDWHSQVDRFGVWSNAFYSPGDLDGDGTDDLIVKPHYESDIAFRITDIYNHNGRFGISNDPNIHGDGQIEPIRYPEEAYNTKDVYFDINNDGALDRIVAASAYKDIPFDPNDHDWFEKNEGVMLWATLGNPFTPEVFNNEQDSFEARSAVHLTHADLGLNGEPVILNSTGASVETVRRNSEGLLGSRRSEGLRFLGQTAGFRTIVTQLDQDSKFDVVSMRNPSASTIPAIYLNAEMPPLGEQSRSSSLNSKINFNQMLIDMGVDFISEYPSFAVGDIDSDGDNDVLSRGRVRIDGEYIDSVLAWKNDGHANFTPGPISVVGATSGFGLNMIALIDHDHDGDQDLISVQDIKDIDVPIVAIYNNDGTGNFVPDLEIPTQHHEYFGAIPQYWIEVNDLDLDGYDDIQVLLWDFNDQSSVVIYYGSPTGISTDPVMIAGHGASEVHCADLDGNGLPDLYTCAYRSSQEQKNSITIMFQTAPREFLPSISINDIDMAAIDALDLNSDGILDLIAGHDASRFLRVLYSVSQPCRADIDLTKHTDFFDISIFLRLFSEKRPLADFNNDGLHDFFDISEFVSAFSEGCP